MDDDNFPSKRRKLDIVHSNPATSDIPAPIFNYSPKSKGKGLDRPISPPLSRSNRSKTPVPSILQYHEQQQAMSAISMEQVQESRQSAIPAIKYVHSPIQLTRIRDLAPAQNVDTIGLNDVLGDPMIKECWNFNYLFDIDFIMEHFDPDTRDLVKIKIIHGFWQNGSDRRIALLEQVEKYANVEQITAFLPDMFGTHHSKMLVLVRHDDQAQVIIHTANMIARDWTNMTQAVWQSPLLPLVPAKDRRELSLSQNIESWKENLSNDQYHPIGSGERFKTDMLRYLGAYGKRVRDLMRQLIDYDFSSIRAAFIASSPSRQKSGLLGPAVQTSWGWLGLREILSTIPDSKAGDSPPTIVIQVSSIATLGQTPTWLSHFQSILSQTSPTATPNFTSSSSSVSSTIFPSKKRLKEGQGANLPSPTFNMIFPTPQEIRTSLDGYQSGHSIHTKITAPAQQKQLTYLHPLLCHWKHLDAPTENATSFRKAERGPAAPHIKTYIRFTDSTTRSIDWAMLTSANLSKQAWGDVVNAKGEIWIQSYEVGVVVWPGVFDDGKERGDGEEMVMVPVFARDGPVEGDVVNGGGMQEGGKGRTIVGFRMPYDLPLEQYGKDEKPWCASSAYEEPDWMGRVWKGYGK
ncbi:tyrosyl-DNA phosphodiesterase I [Dendryphion nanum]|uniref:Tyrosyl-DNA phosphodiesterase I n=1 Tax=Dendryphion nanum TaxID=256645 RepID=A0A9P9DIG1_9PLEO|nr:tyrosyl-DNA phosphodiesterase I [Dendryphion nanum]